MRLITREEAERWTALAKAHGHWTEGGGFDLGRYRVEGMTATGQMVLRLITPLPAGLYTEDLRGKKPPILFDRTPDGKVIIPGRWWQHTFERLSELEGVPEQVRRGAAAVARHGQWTDALLPADTDTIEIEAPDDTGEMVPTEALPPEGRIVLNIVGAEEEG